jgi:hypothetical protein
MPYQGQKRIWESTDSMRLVNWLINQLIQTFVPHYNMRLGLFKWSLAITELSQSWLHDGCKITYCGPFWDVITCVQPTNYEYQVMDICIHICWVTHHNLLTQQVSTWCQTYRWTTRHWHMMCRMFVAITYEHAWYQSSSVQFNVKYTSSMQLITRCGSRYKDLTNYLVDELFTC